jgi:PAS domain S-box-containing protein
MKDGYSFFANHAVRVRDLFFKRLFLLLFPFLLVPNAADAHDELKQILVIHSYHQGLVWTDDIMDGIYSVFDKDDPEIDIHVEYMDTKRHFDGFDGKYLGSLLEVYRNKYRAIKFDAIISSDDNALRFLLMHHEELFPGVPIVFCGVNDYTDEMLSGHEGITGVLEFLDQKASIDIALKLHPEIEQVFVVTDTSTTGKANRLLIQKLADRYWNMPEFVFLDEDNSGLTEEELLDRLKRLPEKSIVYYSDFLRSREGYIDQEAVVPMITSNSRRPVYTHYDEILGLGVVGGKLVNGRSQGQKAAEFASKIMQGTPVSDIQVYKESVNSFMFDNLQLKRYGISEIELPEGSVVINKYHTFYEKHKRKVWLTSGVIGALLILVTFLIFNIARRREAENKLLRANEELEQRVEERTNDLSVSNRMLEDEILERKRAEAEKALLYDSVPGFITVVDTDYRVLRYNRAVEEQFGKDLHGQLCYKVYQARDEICPDCAVKKCIESNKAEYTFQPATSVSGPVEIYAYPIYDDKGNAMAVVEHGLDISEKLEMIEAIKDSEERFRVLFDNAPDAIFLADPDTGYIIDVNSAAENMMKMPKEDIVGLHQSELHPKEREDHSTESFHSHAESKSENLPVENSVCLPDGSEVPVEVLGHTMEIQGKPVIMGIFRNITERKEAEERITKSESLLSQSQKIAHVGSWEWDMLGNKLHWSDETFRLAGRDPKSFVPKFEDFQNLVHEEDREGVFKLLEDVLEGSAQYRIEHRIVLPDGEIRYMRSQGEVERDTDGKPVSMVGTMLDITEQRDAEEKIRESLREKEVLLKEIHHRVKNNMTIVTSMLALQSYYMDDRKLTIVLEDLINRINSMSLVHERLYTSEDLEHIDIQAYLRTLVNDLDSSFSHPDKQISTFIEAEDMNLSIDRLIPLGLLINELVTNSYKHAFNDTDKGEIRICLNTDDSGCIALKISDNGCGLPPDMDLDDYRKTLGIRLAIELAEQLDGTLVISNNKGAEFVVAPRQMV